MMRSSLLSSLWVMLLVVGCAPDGSTPKTSLFEEDHAVAAHWPSGLQDVAVKLRERMTPGDVTSTSIAEVKGIVGWTAEIAADTNMTEQDWIPIYHAAESLSANLRQVDAEFTEADRRQIESLCELIDETSSRVPEFLPNLANDES